MYFSHCMLTLYQGYKRIMENCLENARVLREGLEKTGRFDIVSKDKGVPLVAFSLKDSSKHTVFEIAESLRRFGWIIPAYTMPANAQHIAVLRVVVREDFNRSLAERLVSHIDQVMKETDSLPSRVAVQASRIVTVDETQDNMDGKKTVKKSSREIQEEVTLYWRRLASEKRTGAC